MARECKTLFDILPNLDLNKETGLFIEESGNAFGIDYKKHMEFLGSSDDCLFFPKNVTSICMADEDVMEEAGCGDGFDFPATRFKCCIITTNMEAIDPFMILCNGIEHFFVIDADTNRIVYQTKDFESFAFDLEPSAEFVEFCNQLYEAPWKKS